MKRQPEGRRGQGRYKFNAGDRVRGNGKKASFREKPGTIIKYGPGKGEYLVHFDDGEDHYVNTEWLDRIENEK
jgi:hypothetical protein